MSTDRAGAAVEIAIAKHVANSFQRTRRDGKADAVVVKVRKSITDSFQPSDLQTEQDNQPPALAAFYRRIAAAFAPIAIEHDTPERSSHLSDIRSSLENLRSALSTVAQKSRLGSCQGPSADRTAAIACEERADGRLWPHRSLDSLLRVSGLGSSGCGQHPLGLALSRSQHRQSLVSRQAMQAPPQEDLGHRCFDWPH